MPASISLVASILGVALLAQTVLCVNRAPVWDQRSMDRLRDTFSRQVYENTTENKLLGTLLARDPEGKLVTYGIDSENTVTVDERSGEVRLARSLDREKGDTKVDVTFYAYDPLEAGSNVRNQIDYFMRLDVQDVNDNHPDFRGLPYGASILENTPAYTTVFTKVNIVDLDDGYNAEVFVNCSKKQSPLACKKFGVSNLVQPTQGVYTASIFNTEVLDYEKQSSYIVTLEAWDNGSPRLSSLVNIHIKVIDVQDSPPEFLNTPINLYTNESVAVGSVVGEIQARDQDQGNPRPVTIEIIPGSRNALSFRLLPKSVSSPGANGQAVYTYNVLTNGTQLDRETLRGQASFDVIAIEMNNGTKTNVTTSTTVLVNIFDVNDNAPTFDKKDYFINASESVRATDNTQIPGLTMTVSDQDDASNARFSVSIQSQTYPGAFAVSPSNATSQGPFALTVVNADFMDYENPNYREQTVVVVAREIGTPQLYSSTATVHVRLLDVNDNSPIFEKTDYNITIRENTVQNILTQVKATDADSGLNGKITYQIDAGTQTDIDQIFRIDPSTGVINMSRAVDFERNREFPLVITASDGGSSPRSQKVVLRVIVENVNDQRPEFLISSYETRVTETSTILQPAITVQATDTEEGSGQITYRIVSGNDLPNGTAFSINPQDGRLSLTRTVNFDETPNRRGYFTLVIAASDNALPPMQPLESQTTVKVNVKDENNDAARFDRLVYSASVSELATAGTRVITVNATDQDRGENGRLTYSLQGSLGDFNIDPVTGLIRVSPNAQLDSIRSLYRLTVIATDNGTPRQRSSSAIVNVNVIDKNNKAPSFSEALYTATVSEEELVNSLVLQVTATDPDQNKSLVYSILPTTIQAKDPQGAIFNNPQTFNYRALFYIDADDGEVRLQNKLSYEYVAEMDFAVQVKDVFAETLNPIQTATASVNIRILGSVDATPRFSAPWTPQDPTYFFTIPEETARNTLITTLVATDPIGARPVQNFREVTSVDEQDYFTVDSRTGALLVNNRIDFDTLRTRMLPVEVEAISNDGKKTAIARIRVYIQDINDNSPVFDKESYEFAVPENRVYPFDVGAVLATDADFGDFSKLRYSLSGLGANNFQIEKKGKIIVAPGGSLDREVKEVYELTVTATDNPEGRTQRQGSAQLTIRILDENDASPVFGRPSYSLLTVDTTRVGTGIGTVDATDQDAGTNSQIVYTMNCEKDEANRLFRISLFTGEVVTDDSLDTKSGNYRCTVIASDQGSPPRSSSVPLLIQVSASSSNGNPVFTWPEQRYVGTNVTENSPPGVLVGYVSATSPFGNVSYSFVDNSDTAVLNSFSIDPLSGEVRTIATLDREDRPDYELLIVARVTGNSTLSSNVVLRLTVKDENDNVPRFNEAGCDPELAQNLPYKLYPQEDTPVNTTLMQLSACDADDPATTRTSYTLVTRADNPEMPTLPADCESAAVSPFILRPVNGTVKVSIVVVKPLDHDVMGGDKHLLCIQATDLNTVVSTRKKRQTVVNYDTQGYTVTYIEVNVVDINDNGPKFAVKRSQALILEFPPTNGLVTTVRAIDKDSAPYDRVRYSIQSTVFNSDSGNRNITIAFDIDSITGEVKTTLTRYTQFISGTFVIVIRAEDNLNNAFFDTTTLIVSVVQVGQRLKVTWATRAGQQGDAALKNSIQRDVQEAVSSRGWQLSVDELRYHINNNGEKDPSKLDACFVVVDENGRPPPKDEVIKAIQESSSLDNEYDFGLCDVETSAGLGGGSAYWWVLIALALIIFVGTLILIIIICILAARQRQKMDNMRTSLIQN